MWSRNISDPVFYDRWTGNLGMTMSGLHQPNILFKELTIILRA